MNVDRLIWWGVGLLTLFRWWLGSSMELTEEEALLWMESQRMELYFMDHGPLAPLVIRLASGVFGDSLMGIRYANPLLILLATWLLYLLAKSVFHQVVARWTVVVFQLCPMVNVAGVSMIDVALALCLSLAGYWSLWCALHRVHRWHGAWWGAGAAFGSVATLSLPVGVGLMLGVVMGMLVLSRWAGQWARPGIWIMLGIAGGLPLLLLWGCGHGYLSWRSLFRDLGVHPWSFLSGLATWIWWTGPLLALGVIWVGRRWRRLSHDHGTCFLALLGSVPLVLGFLWSGVSGSWSLHFWTASVPCLVVLIERWLAFDLDLEWKGRWRLWALATTGALGVLGVNTANIRMLGWPWPSAADTLRLEEGWQETAMALEKVLQLGASTQPGGFFVIAHSDGAAALLEFYLSPEAPVFQPDPAYPRVHVVESAGWDSAYARWLNYSHAQPGTRDASPFRQRSAFYLSQGHEADMDALPSNVLHGFRAFEFEALLEVKRGGRLLHAWTLVDAFDYRGLPL